MTMLDVRFSDWIQKGFQLFLANALLLMVCGLVAVAISAITLGLLAGPMMAGMAIVILNLMDDRLAKPTINELFKGFNYFKETFPVTLTLYPLGLGFIILKFVPFLGQVVSTVAISVVGSLTMFSVFHLIARKITPVNSAKNWVELFKVNWGPLLGFFILSSIIGGVGVLFFVIGIAVTVPIHICILGVAYDAISRQAASL